MRVQLMVYTVVLILSISLASADWPMFRANEQRTGYINDTGDLTDPLLLWTFRTPDGVFGTPVAADLNGGGKLEIIIPVEKGEDANHETLFVLDSAGKELWSFESRGGIVGSPVVGDIDRDNDPDVVFGTTSGEIYALEGANGAELWRIDNLVGAFRSSPLIYDLDGDGNVEIFIGSDKEEMYAIDGESGLVEWKFEAEGDILSSPALGQFDKDKELEIVFGSMDGNVYVLDSDGSLSWEKRVGSPILYSSPAISSKSQIMIGSDGGGLHILGEKSIKSFESGASISGSPGILEGGDGLIVFGTAIEEDLHGVYVKYSANRIYGITFEGDKVWEKDTGGWSVFTSPALADIDRDGNIEALIASREGKLYALDALTGEEEWTYMGGTGMFASPVLADIDNDEDLEIILGYRFSNEVRVLDSPDKADLIITNMSFSDYYPEERELVDIDFVVKNRGKLSSGSFNISLFRRSVLMDVEIGEINLSSLDVGESRNLTFPWEAALPAGNLQIYAVLDSGEEVNESNEINNEFSENFGNDLIATVVLFPYDVQGEVNRRKVTISVGIENKGGEDVTGITVDMMWDDKIINSKKIDILSGETKNLDFSLNYEPADIERELSIVVDSKERVSENDETNNALVWSIEAASYTGPDRTGPIIELSQEQQDQTLTIILVLVAAVALWKGIKKVKQKKEERERALKEKQKKEKEEAKEGEEEVEPVVSEEDDDSMITIGERGEPGVDPELERLQKRKEGVEKIIKLTKVKYYKRKLDEDSYKEIMTRNQEDLIKIEAEIDKKKTASEEGYKPPDGEDIKGLVSSEESSEEGSQESSE